MASDSITASERIMELTTINEDVAAMLSSAGQAINALTNRPLGTAYSDQDTEMPDSHKTDTVQSRKDNFRKHSKDYYTHLQAVIARLRRQAYALEEAGIIAAHPAFLSNPPPRPTPVVHPAQQRGMPAAPRVNETERIFNGGLGKFDVGWLNSRGNKVGAEKEAELVQEAKTMLEQELQGGKT